MSIEVIMRRLGYSSRATYYRHKNTPDLSLNIISRYGRVIHHDFDIDLDTEVLSGVAESPQTYLSRPDTLEDAIDQRDFYWRKYNQQLEEYRKLLLKYEALTNQNAQRK